MFGTSPQSSKSVADTTWTVASPPGARSSGPHASSVAFERPATGLGLDASRRSRPASVSLAETSKAVPSPLFWNVIVKPICSPATTGGLVVRGLDDAEHGAEHVDVGFGAVVAFSARGLVVRADLDGVGERAAVLEVRVAADVDDDHVVERQVAEVAVEHAAGDRVARVGDRTRRSG